LILPLARGKTAAGLLCSGGTNVTLNLLKSFWAEEDGPTAVEYAIMLSLIAVVCIVSVRNIGTSSSSTFNRVATAIRNGSAS